MTTNFSPNVTAREFDFSDYAVRASTSILAIVGHCTKGPCHQPIRISNERELIDTFGYPTTTTVGQDTITSNFILPAIQYLREGNQLVVVRCNTGATSAHEVFVDAVAAVALRIDAISPGSWAALQSLAVVISPATAGGDYFKITVYVDGVAREKYDNLTQGSGDPSNWPSARINPTSFLIQATEITATRPIDVGSSATPTAISGGGDGSVTPSSYGIDSPGQGLSALLDTDLVTINMLATPGVEQLIGTGDAYAVSKYAIYVCESRGDTIYFADPKFTDTTVSALRTAANTTAAFDSSYGAFFAHWVLLYDGYNRKSVYVPPSTLVAAQCAFTDRVAHAWYAPAGLNRGKLKLAQGVKVNFTRDDLEMLQAPREIVNPIRNMVGEGVVIWGQKTTQRRSSALDRINVRRMLNYAKATVVGATKVILFDPNDSKTWRKFTQLVTPIIQQIKDSRGLYDFRVICDESTNPPSVVDQNQVVGKILLKPTKTAEVITVDFNILSTGASFTEFV